MDLDRYQTSVPGSSNDALVVDLEKSEPILMYCDSCPSLPAVLTLRVVNTSGNQRFEWARK